MTGCQCLYAGFTLVAKEKVVNWMLCVMKLNLLLPTFVPDDQIHQPEKGTRLY